MSLIALFEQFQYVWLLQTGYSWSFSRELIMKTCLGRLSNTLHFDKNLQTCVPSPIRVLQKITSNVEPQSDQQRNVNWETTSLSNLPKYSKLRKCSQTFLFYHITVQALYFYLSSSSRLCHRLQMPTRLLAKQEDQKRKRNVSHRYISPSFACLNF